MSVDKFEQKLREKFEAVSIPPSPELWGNIESRIPQKEKKRGIIWFWAGGVSIAASLLVWLWLSNAAIQTTLETETTISQVEEEAPQTEEAIIKYEANESSTPSLTDHKSSDQSEEQNDLNQQGLNLTPDWVERTAVRAPSVERSAAQNDPNPVIASTQTETTHAENPSKIGEIRSLDHDMALLALGSVPVALPLDSKLYLPTVEPIWWEEAVLSSSIGEENVPRWAVNLQAGQDLIGDISANFSNLDASPSEFLADQKASNDALLGTADYVQFARNPYQAFNQEGVDQATLVSYPTQESRIKIVGEYQLQGHWSLRTGLGLGISNQGALTQANVVYDGTISPTTTSEGEWTYTDGPSLQNLQLEVPFTLQYRINRSKGNLVFGSGFSFNHNLNYLSQARYNRDGFISNDATRTVFAVSDQAKALSAGGGDLAASQSLGYRSWNSFVLLQAQYERSISPRMALFAGPSFKYMLNDIFVGSLASKQAPFRIGLTAGLRFGR